MNLRTDVLVVEGLVPAIEPDDYRYITAKTIANYQATNIVEKQVKNNTKCFMLETLPSSRDL
jgi:hypothetical protein